MDSTPDRHSTTWLASVWEDVRQAVRALRRQPAFASVVVATFALGLALVTLQLSFVNGALLNRLPYPRADELLRIDALQGGSNYPLSHRAFLEWRTQQRSFARLGAYVTERATLSAPGLDARRYRSAALSAALLPVLEVRPMIGRGFVPEDERAGAAPVVLLGEELWAREFRRNREVVGTTLSVNGESATVVGVMPRGFAFPFSEQLWTNLRMPAGSDTLVWLLGRPRPGVSANAAQVEMQGLLKAHAVSREESPGVRVWPLRDWATDDNFRLSMMLLLGLAMGVLLMAAVNAADLLLLRAMRRIPELALRATLGAGRARLAQLMIAEALVLAVGGATVGWLLAAWAAPLVNRQLRANPDMPYWIRLDVDWRIFGACMLLATGLGLLCGLVAAWRVSGLRSLVRFREGAQVTGGLAYGRFSRVVVTLQFCLACGLLLVTAMFVKAGLQLGDVDFRFDAARTLGATLVLDGSHDLPDRLARMQFGDDLRARLRTLPAVSGVTFSSRHPADQGMGGPVEAEEQPAASWNSAAWAFQETIAPGFFRALGIRVAAGRAYSDSEAQGAGPQVVVVSESLARRLWPGASAIGRRLRDLPPPDRPGQQNPWLTVIGVAPDLPLRGVLNPRLTPGYYVPFGQRMPEQITVLVGVTGDPSLVAKPLRDVVRALAPDVPVDAVQSVQARAAQSLAFFRSIGLLALAFGLGSLFLAATGVHGTVAFTVRQRAREFGVRLALGAVRRDILVLVMRQTSVQLLIGLSGGLALGWVLPRVVRAQPRLVSALEPWHVALAVGVVSLTAFIAVWLPVRRAAKINPVDALRAD
jgi:putative ABC transport system permease protein